MAATSRWRRLITRQALLTLCAVRLPTLLRAQVHVVKRDGSNQLLETFDDKPSYAQLEVALKAWPEAAVNKSLMDRLMDEAKFIQDTAQQPGRKE